MIGLPFIAGGLVVYLAMRALARRRRRGLVRLRDGRRVRLLSSVALLNPSAGDLLALEYSSVLPDPAPEELRLEARTLVQTVGARAEYAPCRSALVTVRRPGERRDGADTPERTFTFRRADSGPEWYPTEGLD